MPPDSFYNQGAGRGRGTILFKDVGGDEVYAHVGNTGGDLRGVDRPDIDFPAVFMQASDHIKCQRTVINVKVSFVFYQALAKVVRHLFTNQKLRRLCGIFFAQIKQILIAEGDENNSGERPPLLPGFRQFQGLPRG